MPCRPVRLRQCRTHNDLVFVNQSDAVIVEVVVDFQDQNGGTRNADSSPLKRGETFGFEAGEYPVTVYVYDKVANDVVEGALASLTIASPTARPRPRGSAGMSPPGAGRMD